MDRHLRKLDQELSRFKMELEADCSGITEILERRKFGEVIIFGCFRDSKKTHVMLWYIQFICVF